MLALKPCVLRINTNIFFVFFKARLRNSSCDIIIIMSIYDLVSDDLLYGRKTLCNYIIDTATLAFSTTPSNFSIKNECVESVAGSSSSELPRTLGLVLKYVFESLVYSSKRKVK